MNILTNRYFYNFSYRLLLAIFKITGIVSIREKADLLCYLRMRSVYSRKGVHLGENTMLYSVTISSSLKGDTFVIGNNCTLTGCTLLGHDASPTIFIAELQKDKRIYITGARRSFRNPIRIGSNVFVGFGSILLPGITVGDNVVIAAGSIVTKDVPSNVVIAGNPARVISDISIFIDKYRNLYLNNPNDF